MTRKGEGSTKTAGMMMSLFVVILISYLAYIMLLHPWERKQLLTERSNITVNLYDCDSGLPITDGTVSIYTEEGNLIEELNTNTNGSITYQDFPDCYRIKATVGNDHYENICVGSGEERLISICFEHPEANPRVIHYEQDVGIIGGSGGETMSTKEFDNVILSYPISNTTINYPSYFLYSNILWSEGMGVQLNNIDENITRNIDFMFTMQSKRGNPTTEVYVNNKLVFKDEVDVNETVTVNIPRQELNETIDIQVKCDFNGFYFWTTQDCNLSNIKAVQDFFVPDKPSQEFRFDTSLFEQEAESIDLKFISINEAIGGVKASINGVQLFNSDSLETTNYTATKPLISLNLTNTSNLLKFEANPGAQAYLRGVKLLFNQPYLEARQKELKFYITEEEFLEMNKVVFNIYISNIYLDGALNFRVNDDVTYVTTINKAGWDRFSVDVEDLTNENNLVISSPEGRFEIDQLKITYE